MRLCLRSAGTGISPKHKTIAAADQTKRPSVTVTSAQVKAFRKIESEGMQEEMHLRSAHEERTTKAMLSSCTVQNTQRSQPTRDHGFKQS